MDLDVRAPELEAAAPSGCLGDDLVVAHPSEDAASAESLTAVLHHAQDAMVARAGARQSHPLVITLEPKDLSLQQTAKLWRAAAAASASGLLRVSPILNHLEDARVVAAAAQEEMAGGGCGWGTLPPLTLALRDRPNAVDEDSLQLCRGILPQLPASSGRLWALMPSLHWLRACSSHPGPLSAVTAIGSDTLEVSPNTNAIRERAGRGAGGVNTLIEQSDAQLRVFPWIIDSAGAAREVQALLPDGSAQHTFSVSNRAPQVLKALQS